MAKTKPKTGRGGRREGAGRKRNPIDLVALEAMCSVFATDVEIASFFGVHVDTIGNLKKREPYASTIAKGKAKGKLSLRRAQFDAAIKGNATMLVWLGKQVLGQRDELEVLGASAGAPPKIEVVYVQNKAKAQEPDESEQ
jgi:hypothetical protein